MQATSSSSLHLAGQSNYFYFILYMFFLIFRNNMHFFYWRRGCFSHFFYWLRYRRAVSSRLNYFLYCWCYRWAAFRQHIREIDDNAKLLCTNQLIKYQQHVGGGNYVSVTSGFQCVDFRQFYMPYGGVEVRPTKKGIALRICEWIELLRVVEVINNAYPDLATALPCYMEADHANQMSALQCSECYPFVDATSF